MTDPITISLDGPIPTEPGLYAWSDNPNGGCVLDLNYACGLGSGPLYFTTDDGYELPMPTHGKWSRRILIQTEPKL